MAVLTYGQVQNIMRQVGFPESEIVLGAAVFKQESSFKTDAIGTIAKGREYSVGIAQINTFAHKTYSVEQLKDPVINLKEAYRIWKNDKDRNGKFKRWRSWGGFTDGGYKKYMAESQKAYSGSSSPVQNVYPVVPVENPQNNNSPQTSQNFLTSPSTMTGAGVAAVVLIGILIFKD
ncbi:MAG TPA: transglycosylase SLT domain-containing protein [Pyrinomonadaceae bacterium]|jgi:hypothetical protein